MKINHVFRLRENKAKQTQFPSRKRTFLPIFLAYFTQTTQADSAVTYATALAWTRVHILSISSLPIPCRKPFPPFLSAFSSAFSYGSHPTRRPWQLLKAEKRQNFTKKVPFFGSYTQGSDPDRAAIAIVPLYIDATAIQLL